MLPAKSDNLDNWFDTRVVSPEAVKASTVEIWPKQREMRVPFPFLQIREKPRRFTGVLAGGRVVTTCEILGGMPFLRPGKEVAYKILRGWDCEPGAGYLFGTAGSTLGVMVLSLEPGAGEAQEPGEINPGEYLVDFSPSMPSDALPLALLRDSVGSGTLDLEVVTFSRLRGAFISGRATGSIGSPFMQVDIEILPGEEGSPVWLRRGPLLGPIITPAGVTRDSAPCLVRLEAGLPMLFADKFRWLEWDVATGAPARPAEGW